MRKLFILLAVFLLGAIAVFWISRHGLRLPIHVPPITVIPDAKASSMSTGKQYTVKKIQVIQGHLFDVTLDNGGRYLVYLEGIVDTPTKAKSAVVRLLNEHQQKNETLVLEARHWDESKGRWSVSLYYDGNLRHSLSDWLVSQGLAYIKAE